MRPSLLILVAAVIFTSAGCDVRSPFHRTPVAPPKSISWHTTPKAIEPMRIAVVPFAMAERVGKGAAELTPAFSSSLRSLGLHQVVLIGAEVAAKLPLPDLHAGSVSVDSLLAVREATGCDAVIFGRVELFDGYHPISLSVSVHLVSCQDGAVLWTADAHLDGNRDDVQQDIEGWWKRNRGEATAALNEWRSTLETPREFCAYATDRLTWTIGKNPE